MNRQLKTPTPRCLDIYRLVVAHHWPQLRTAQAFGVSTPRVCQIVRRVRAWVNASIGEWLFPGRDDLRFYTALQCAHIRLQVAKEDPESILIAGPGWTYTRHSSPCGAGVPPANMATAPSANISANIDAHLTSQPVNNLSATPLPPSDATPNCKNDFDAQLTDDLARHLAHLLIDWRKSRSVTSVIKTSAY
jgi:hypothetical protein